MGTPRKLVAKPGRPRKHAVTANRRRGRPRLAIEHDPLRYAVALHDALSAMTPDASGRAIEIAVVAMFVGFNVIRPMPARYGLMQTKWQRFRRYRMVNDWNSHRSTLRAALARHRDRHAVGWRMAMASAITLAMRGRLERLADVKVEILRLAGAVGEALFAVRVLLPIIDCRLPAPSPAPLVPEFS